MRSTLKVIGLTFGALFMLQTAYADDGCTQIMGNPETKDGVKVCNDGSVEVGGQIKDTSMETPLGKGDAFVPKAGRDIEGAAHAVGHGVEHLGGEINKIGQQIFGW
jgi:hypothetical protein